MQAAPIGSTAMASSARGLLGTANAVCCVLHVLEEAWRAAFTLFDVDGDGFISGEDLAYLFAGQDELLEKNGPGRPPKSIGDSALQLLGSKCTELNRLLLEGVANGQGSIDFQKFKFMMSGFDASVRSTFPQVKREAHASPVPPAQAPPEPEFRSPSSRKMQMSAFDLPDLSLSNPGSEPGSRKGSKKATRSSAPSANEVVSSEKQIGRRVLPNAEASAVPSRIGASQRHSVGGCLGSAPGSLLLVDPNQLKMKGNLSRSMTTKSPLPGSAPTNLVRSATVLFGGKHKSKKTRIDPGEPETKGQKELEEAGDRELPGPNPLWEIFKQKKIDMKKLRSMLETDHVKYLNTCLCIEEDVPQAIFLAVALRQPEMVKMLISSHADVTKRMPCKKAWKHVKPNQTVLDVNDSQKSRYVGTVLYERCEAIQSLLKAEEDRQRGWRSGLRASSAAQRYFDEDHQNESSICDIEKEQADDQAEAKAPKTPQEVAAAAAELALSRKTLYSAQATFVCQHISGNPADSYTIGAVEGEGTFGIVSVAWDKLTSFERAVKKVPKTLLEESDLWQEIEIMRDLDHPYVTRLYTTYEDSENIYMIMENCAGGELFDAVMEAGNLPDAPARRIFRQMLVATSYLHQNGICHRDLKPENFLLSRLGDPDDACVKLIDFGTARRFSADDPMTTKICTIHYAAPEILAKHTTSYTEKCDMWSLGICLYVMLSGNLPFAGDSDTQVLRKARKGKFEFEPEDIWDDVTDESKDIVTSLLKLAPEERMSANQRLVGSFATDTDQTPVDQHQVVHRLLDFHRCSWLKQTSLELVASQLPEEDIEDLQQIWFKLDAANNGKLRHEQILANDSTVSGDTEEQKAALLAERAELMKILDQEDIERHKDVSYTSFLAAMLNAEQRFSEEACKAAFALLDLDDDGLIRLTDLGIIFTSNHLDLRTKQSEASRGKNGAQMVLSLPHLEGRLLQECQVIIDAYDVNKDEALDFDEFMSMMRS